MTIMYGRVHEDGPEIPRGQFTDEHDPNGLSSNTPGAKLDAGKVRPELIIRGFSRALLAVSDVGTYGANKYSADGWEKVTNGVQRYTDAMYRHLLKEHTGEQRDPDTQILHAAHAAWNALARLELMLREAALESAVEDMGDAIREHAANPMQNAEKAPEWETGA